jgi:HTH-type transcriptional regulator/antitoxin MqsA
MFRCHVCGNDSAKPGFVSEVFTIDGRRVLVEKIPAEICERCGEATFSRETTEKIRRLVHGAGQPSKTVPLDVFALA